MSVSSIPESQNQSIDLNLGSIAKDMAIVGSISFALTALFTAGNPYIGAGLGVSAIVVNQAVNYAVSYFNNFGLTLPHSEDDRTNSVNENLMLIVAKSTAIFALSTFIAYEAMISAGYVIPTATAAMVFAPNLIGACLIVCALSCLSFMDSIEDEGS